MSETIDSLDIQIKASATKADDAIDKLVGKLEKLSSSLGSLNTAGLGNLAKGVSELSGAMQGMKNIGTADFTRLAKNITKMGEIDSASIGRAASSLNRFANSLGTLDSVNVSDNVSQIGQLANGIKQLGYKSSTQAIENIPKLATAMRQLMTELSKAPKVSLNLINMTSALSGLAGSLSGVHTTAEASSNSSGNLKKLSSAMDVLSGKANKAGKSLKSFSQIAGSFYANFYMVIRGLKGLWSSVESSMDFLETVNYFEVAMRKLGDDAAANWEQAGYDSAEAYASSFSERAKKLTEKMTGYQIDQNGNATYTGLKNLGMNPESVMNYQAMFAQVSESIGVAEESALNFSTALTMLGADWASLRNTTFEEAWGKFASALSGQSRAVRAFGIDITNATLQEYAYKYGLTQAVSEMNQATKAQLRLLAILDQSEVAFGDLANTMQSPANQLRMLKQNFANLARTIGNLFLPVVEQVLPYINGLVMSLQRLFSWIGGLLGIKFNSINSSIGGMDSGIEDLVGGADDAEDSLNGANDAAKKLKNTLLGFDEINQLNDNTDSSSRGSGSGASVGGGSALLDEEIAKALEAYQKAWDEAFDRMENKAQDISDRICNAFKRGDYEGIGKYISNGITKGLESINWDSVYSVAKNFGKGFAEFLNGLISPSLFSTVGKTIAGALNTAIYAELSFGENFDFKNLGNSIAAGINSFFRTFDFTALARSVNVWAKGILDTIIIALDNTDWEMIGRQIGTFFAEIDFTEVGVKVGKAIWKAINAGVDIFKGMFDAAPIEGTIVSILGFNKAWKAITGTNFTKALKSIKLMTKAFGGNQSAVLELTEKYPKLSKVVTTSTSKFTSFKNLFKGNFFGNLKTEISNIGSKMTGLQKCALGTVAVFGEFSLVKSGFKDIASGADNIVSSMGKITVGAGAAVAALKLIGLSNPWTAAITGIVGVVAAIKGINDAINELQLNSMFETIKMNGVTSLEALGNVAIESFGKITSGVDTTIEKLDSISQTRESITGAVSNIDSLRIAIDNGAYSVSEKVPEIIDQFQGLLEQSKSIFDEEYDVIVGNIVGAWADILTAQGQSVPEYVAGLLEMTSKGKTAYGDLEASIESLIEQYQNGEISAEDFYEKSEPLFEKIKNFNADGSVDNTTSAIQDLGGALDLSQYITDNSLDTSKFQTYVDTVIQTAKDGKTNLETLGEENAKSIDNYKQQLDALGVDTSNYDWASLYGANDAQVAQGISDIDAAYQDYADQIQYCVMEQLPSLVDEATKDYEKLNPLQKLFTTKEEYVNGVIDKWKENTLKPVSDTIKDSFEQLGIDAEPWAEETATKIVDSLFDTFIITSGGRREEQTRLKENWKSILDGALSEAAEAIDAESYRKDTIDGYNRGISNNVSSSKEVIQKWMSNVNKSIHDSDMAFGSPSKTAENYGKLTIDGFNNGIKNSTVLSSTAISSWMTSVKSSLESQWNNLKSWWEGLRLNFPQVAMPHFKITGEFNLETKAVPTVSVNYYAQGGMPNTGELFMARENGINEMVGRIGNHSAVANNDQITQAFANEIRPAMTEAFVEALMMTSGATSNGGQEPIVEVTIKADSETMYNIVRKGKEKHDRRYHVVTEF